MLKNEIYWKQKELERRKTFFLTAINETEGIAQIINKQCFDKIVRTIEKTNNPSTKDKDSRQEEIRKLMQTIIKDEAYNNLCRKAYRMLGADFIRGLVSEYPSIVTDLYRAGKKIHNEASYFVILVSSEIKKKY